MEFYTVFLVLLMLFVMIPLLLYAGWEAFSGRRGASSEKSRASTTE